VSQYFCSSNAPLPTSTMNSDLFEQSFPLPPRNEPWMIQPY
jgi:hypothetical protein